MEHRIYRFFGGAALLIAVFGRRQNSYKGHNIRLLIIRGCTGCFAFICIVTAIRLLRRFNGVGYFLFISQLQGRPTAAGAMILIQKRGAIRLAAAIGPYV